MTTYQHPTGDTTSENITYPDAIRATLGTVMGWSKQLAAMIEHLDEIGLPVLDPDKPPVLADTTEDIAGSLKTAQEMLDLIIGAYVRESADVQDQAQQAARAQQQAQYGGQQR